MGIKKRQRWEDREDQMKEEKENEVDLGEFESPTPWLRTRCSTNWAIGPTTWDVRYRSKILKPQKNKKFLIESAFNIEIDGEGNVIHNQDMFTLTDFDGNQIDGYWPNLIANTGLQQDVTTFLMNSLGW